MDNIPVNTVMGVGESHIAVIEGGGRVEDVFCSEIGDKTRGNRRGVNGNALNGIYWQRILRVCSGTDVSQ